MAENTNTPAPTRNDELLEAVKEMRAAYAEFRENESDENRTKINDANSKIINLTLRATFIVPAIISKNTQLVQDQQNHLKFEEKPQARFMLVKHKENGTFFPVFTDDEEFAKMQNKEGFNGVSMKFADIATLTEQTPNIAGFVVNPMSTNLPYTKEMLAQIKQTLLNARERRQVAEAQKASAEAAGITVSEGGADSE
ncbi:SseB protein N-terminal domain-containing protein [Ruminococcus sp. YE71]|uniref:SseB family protein n=1 Tax=unclassified Ruminococcus TaxID=2608920 RepID=UPI000885B891|nr:MULTISPECIES: SseB family protein [unclassified Ruminococcus]SDA11114.1 SseB protein N-terminal domain-containing protein [Ruminococcus sp. YE78]SFW14747.1 SseB protein N-terminal domain-containing protein [Ruminococcus sp. YE71]